MSRARMSSPRVVVAHVALVAFGAAQCAEPFTPRPGPAPLQGASVLRRATDRNPDPRIVEVDLEAREDSWEIAPGEVVRAMTYNGGVPGPTIEANAGDTVIVHFTNRLSEPTTIHWHGLRVPADQDGGPHSQAPVMPGGRFDYRFTVPDAGTFWYHPHVHEGVQMERGLYGAIIVRGAREPDADAEALLVLDDLTLGANGQIAPPAGVVEHHAGREGPRSIVNGRADTVLGFRAGQRQRWRIVNAGSARFYRLALAGHRFAVVGTDGGPLPAVRFENELMLVPGDRLDVLVDGAARPGETLSLVNLPYDRGHGAGVTEAMNIARVQFSADAPVAALPVPVSAGGPIESVPVDGAPLRTFTFGEFIDRPNDRVVFTINGQSYPNVPDTEARVGVAEHWELVNESEMEHPFHLHGFFFQVLSRNGVTASERAWEDTIQLRGHERVRIAFRPDNRPGAWMFHCHILEHVDNGMMAMVHVR